MRERAYRSRHSDRPPAAARSGNTHRPRREGDPSGFDGLHLLTASIGHELNQPLSAILTNASACLRMLSADPPKLEGARETARRTIRDVNRAADIVDRLRALFSRAPPVAEPLSLNDAVGEAVALLRGELDAARIVVGYDLAEDLPLLAADRVQLQQVILNLIRNAAEAMAGVTGRPRHLTLTTRLDGSGRALLSVRDAGIGIRAAEAEHLFTPFYTTKAHGMGIGLSVSRTIVEKHRGHLWCEPNAEGAGATFHVVVPCVAGNSSSDAEPPGSRVWTAATATLASDP